MYRSPAEVHEQYLRTLPPEVGPLFIEVMREATWLMLTWQEYKTLYTTNEKRVELLNQSAPVFFRVVQGAMLNQVLLYLTRLTDPVSHGKDRNNLTVRALPSVSPTVIRDRLQAAVDDAVKSAEFAKVLRDKRIAHSDLASVFGKDMMDIPVPTRQMIEASIQAVWNVVSILGSYANDEISPELVYGPEGGEQLLLLICKGLKSEQDKMRRINSGTYTQYDLEPEPPL